MKFLKIISLLFVIFGFCPNENLVRAGTGAANPKSYKVLSTNNKNLSIKSQNLGANYIAFGAFFDTSTKEKTTKIVLSDYKNIRKNT